MLYLNKQLGGLYVQFLRHFLSGTFCQFEGGTLIHVTQKSDYIRYNQAFLSYFRRVGHGRGDLPRYIP